MYIDSKGQANKEEEKKMYNLKEIIERLETVAEGMEEGKDKYNLEGEIEHLKQTVKAMEQLI